MSSRRGEKRKWGDQIAEYAEGERDKQEEEGTDSAAGYLQLPVIVIAECT
jgi:hypothetical protein